jgi:galactosamine-6-phosphate isomerase
MKVEFLDDYELLSRRACDIIIEGLAGNPGMLLCTASGASPLLTYHLLEKKYKEKPGQFDKLRVLKLDEWGGIAMDNPQTCEVFLQESIIRPLHLDPGRYAGFKSNPERPEKECARMASWLKHNGPVDLCVLGIGLNGHIAFNEPGDHLHPHCHIAVLSEQSMQHPMAVLMGEKPSYGLTIGMADILRSKKIIMLVTGSGKKEMISTFLSGKITTALPASFLWLHPDVVCLVDKNAR